MEHRLKDTKLQLLIIGCAKRARITIDSLNGSGVDTDAAIYQPLDEITVGYSLARNFEIVPIGSPEDVARLLEAKLAGKRVMLLDGANLSILLKNWAKG